MKKREETLKQSALFERYYLMPKRSLYKLYDELFEENPKCVCLRTLCRWSKRFNWQERVAQRDEEISKMLAKDSIEDAIKIKNEYRREIKNNIILVKAAMATAVEKLKKKAIAISNLKDIEKLVNAYEKLVKLDLLLIGEATERTEEKTLADFLKGDSEVNEIKSILQSYKRKYPLREMDAGFSKN